MNSERFWMLFTVVAFFTKYCVGLYILFQLMFGVGFSPPVWYYYPLLVFLMFAIFRVQVAGVKLSNSYHKVKESDGPEV